MSLRSTNESEREPSVPDFFPWPGPLRPLDDLPRSIRLADETFHRDLPRLIEERPGEWVAYHGDRRIGVAPTKAELYQECLRRGLKRGEFLVRSIESGMGEVVIGPDDLGSIISDQG